MLYFDIHGLEHRIVYRIATIEHTDFHYLTLPGERIRLKK